ncbi:hypothetical protein [Caulobacter segnis]|uniref:hypothetical protein n=1 Tax=Caulobacter segnis TaxID=88688 RepID=UPI0028606530|nr:hypothetical protein [Caulobacter segnis]MDR6624533.1 hypothetical protein [Caulobacter segnis]
MGVRLPLSREQLAAIEDLRDAGDLQFQVTLSGEGGPNGREQLAPVQEVFVLSVARSAWIASMNAAKAMDILLLEIPMPFVDAPAAGRELTEMLRRAQGLFLNGDYPETLARCRSVLEALGTLQTRDVRWPDAALDDLKASRSRDLTKEQRLRSIEAALMQLTHLGAHPNEVKIDRRDAKLVLALTAGILAFEIA